MTDFIFINCLNCNVECPVRTAEINRGGGKYCSRICANQAINKRKKENKPPPNAICNYCNISIYKKESIIKKSNNGIFYCSRKHQDLDKIKPKGNCINCNIDLKDKQEKYCSYNCQWRTTYKQNIIDWKNGIKQGIDAGEGICLWLRRYLIDKYGNKCSQCNWCEMNIHTKRVPIQVDHIDGDYKNNKEENLRLLCPNCHSLTSTYGGANKGKGREKRRVKLQAYKNIGIDMKTNIKINASGHTVDAVYDDETKESTFIDPIDNEETIAYDQCHPIIDSYVSENGDIVEEVKDRHTERVLGKIINGKVQ